MAKVADGGSVPGTGEDAAVEEQPSTRLRQTTPYPKENGTVGYTDVPQPTGPQVRYVGPATRRILTEADWERVGVDDTEHKTYVWDMSNAKQMDKSLFSPKQLEYLEKDNRFVVESD